MTVIVAIPVNRGDGKPYVLMASDSKTTREDFDGSNSSSLSERAEKIAQVHNKLIGISGMSWDEFRDIFLKAMTDRTSKETDIRQFTEIAMQLVHEYFQAESRMDVQVSIRIGCVSNGVAAVSGFDANKIVKTFIPHYHSADRPGFQLIFAGLPMLDQIRKRCEEKIRKSNLSPNIVGRFASDCLREAARLYPESCNQIIIKRVVR